MSILPIPYCSHRTMRTVWRRVSPHARQALSEYLCPLRLEHPQRTRVVTAPCLVQVGSWVCLADAQLHYPLSTVRLSAPLRRSTSSGPRGQIRPLEDSRRMPGWFSWRMLPDTQLASEFPWRLTAWMRSFQMATPGTML